MNMPILQRSDKVYTFQRKYQKRIAINLTAQQIDHSRDMFAGDGPVRAGALHGQILPLRGKDGDTQRIGKRENGGVQFPVEKLGKNPRIPTETVDQGVCLHSGYRRYVDRYLIRPCS